MPWGQRRSGPQVTYVGEGLKRRSTENAPEPEPEPIDHLECGPRKNKFRGCLVGGVIGDCLGAPFESCKKHLDGSQVPKFLDAIFQQTPASNLSGRNVKSDKSRPHGGFYQHTDDTALSFALAQSLCKHRGFDAKETAEMFVNEYYSNKELQREYAGGARKLFKEMKEKHWEDIFQPAMLLFNNEGSFGNGAAMRVAPVPLLYSKKIDSAVQVAGLQAKLTHAHVDGIGGAVLQCLAIHHALELDPSVPVNTEEFIEYLEKGIIEYDANQTYYNKLQILKQLLLVETPKVEEIRERLGNAVIAPESVPTAIYCFLQQAREMPLNQDYDNTSNPFVKIMTLVLSIGGDTDTIGIMAGSIAGAFYGISLIPKVFQEYCNGVHKAVVLADDILKHSTRCPMLLK